MGMVKRWQIYYLNLDPTQGSEQAGTRPAIVVSADIVNVLNQVTIIPLTSYKGKERIYPNEVLVPKRKSNLSKDSIAMAHQIRTVDKSRLATLTSRLDDKALQREIENAIKFQLGID